MASASSGTVEAILFADLAGFTALTNIHGDERGFDVASRFVQLAELARAGRGTLVKTIGDAVMLASSSAPELLDIARSIQADVGREPEFPAVRVGIDYGPVLIREGDRYGETVNIASRVVAHARSGQILATAAVRDATDAAPSAALGPIRLRGVLQPVHLFDLSSISGEPEVDVDPVCHMQIVGPAAASLPYGDRTWHFCSFACARTFALSPSRFLP